MMKKIYLSISALIFLLLPNFLFAQASGYSFTSTPGTYTPITGGTLIIGGTSAMDSYVSGAITLPTAFTFNGTAYTTAYASSNGFITLGGSAPSTTQYLSLDDASTGSGSKNVIAAFSADLDKAASGTPEMRWEQVGSEIVFQWQDFRRYLATEKFSFQIRLNTTNGQIKMVYSGTSSASTATTYQPQVGIRSATTGDYKALKVGTGAETWENPLFATTSTDILRFTSTAPAKFPDEGRTYTWTPNPCQSPSNLTGTNTTTSATFNWGVPTSGDPVQEYQYELRTSGAAGSGATGLVTSGNTTNLTVTFNNLVGDRAYTFYIRTSCSGGGLSGWLPFTFTTRLNNECAGARTITVNTSDACTNFLTDSTTLATQSLAGCAGTADDDIWFKFTASATSHRVKLFNKSAIAPGTSVDLVFQVFSGTCGSLTSMLCSDPDSAIVTGLTAGTEYFIRVYNFSTSSFTKFDICVSALPTPPANDDCSGAITLTPTAGNTCAQPVAGTTYGATATTGETAPTCSATGVNDDVWYKFTATKTSHYVNISGATSTTAAAVYSGGCGGLTQVASACASTNVTAANLTVGNTYYVRVYTTSTAYVNANFGICITSPAVNDECTGAISLPVSSSNTCSTPTAASTFNSTQSTQAIPTCTGVNDDVWYSFVATATSHTVVTSNASSTINLALYSGSCASLTFIGFCGSSYAQASSLVIGQTYYIRAYTSSTTATTFGTFDICVISPPANDECANATTLTVSSSASCSSPTAGNTSGSTSSSAETAPGCSATGINDDVWYKFTATATSHAVSVNNTAIVTQVYSGTCGGLALVASACGTNIIAAGLTVGNVYYVRAFTSSSATTTTAAFTICVSAIATNDECATAIALTPGSNCTPTAASTIGATQSADAAPTCSATGINDDVWFSFVASNTSHIVLIAGATSTTATAVYSGSCGSLTQLTGACVSGSQTVSGLTVGTTYYVRAYTTSATATTYSTFNICITVPQVNDECSGAATVTQQGFSNNPSTFTVITETATQSTNTSSCFSSSNDDDLWYKFTATNSTLIMRVSNFQATSGTPAGVDYGVYTATANCASTTEVACAFSAITSGDITVTGLTVGTQYFLRLLTDGTGGRASFNIALMSPTVVPITLSSFTGERNGAVNQLKWTTSTEVNNKGFDLERSQNGVTFGSIGFIASNTVNGNSSNPVAYSFTDLQPAKGINYYRLKQIDIDGRYSYSNVVAIAGARPTSLEITNVFPNPAAEVLNLVIGSPESKNASFVITDVMGRNMFSETKRIVAGHSNISINVSTLPAGTYFIKAVCSEGCEAVTSRFVKQ
jgi:hypothetical protein